MQLHAITFEKQANSNSEKNFYNTTPWIACVIDELNHRN